MGSNRSQIILFFILATISFSFDSMAVDFEGIIKRVSVSDVDYLIGPIASKDISIAQRNGWLEPNQSWNSRFLLVKPLRSGRLETREQFLRQAVFTYLQYQYLLGHSRTDSWQEKLNEIELHRLKRFAQENIAGLRSLLTGFVTATATTGSAWVGGAKAAGGFINGAIIDVTIQGEDWLRGQVALYWNKIKEAFQTLIEYFDRYKDDSYIPTFEEAQQILAARFWIRVVYFPLIDLDEAIHDYHPLSYLQEVVTNLGFSLAGPVVGDDVITSVAEAVMQHGGDIFAPLRENIGIDNLPLLLQEIETITAVYQYFNSVHPDTWVRFPEFQRFGDAVQRNALDFIEKRKGEIDMHLLLALNMTQTEPPAPPDFSQGFFEQLLTFLSSLAQWIGDQGVNLLDQFIPLKDPSQLADPLGFLVLLTVILFFTEVAKKIVWLVVSVGWVLLIVRIVLEALQS